VESNWRRNVQLFGLPFQGIRKIARLVGQPTIAVSDREMGIPGICLLYQNFLVTEFWTDWFAVTRPDPNANFPYGFNVEPD